MSSTGTVEFVERRNPCSNSEATIAERRQFAESRDGLSPDVRELAEAIDSYKLAHRRRYITLGEVLEVVKSLGYNK